MYSRVTLIKPLKCCMATFSGRPTNPTVLLTLSHDCSCYVSWRMLEFLPLWLQKHDDIHAHDFVRSPDLWRKPKVANITCAWSYRDFMELFLLWTDKELTLRPAMKLGLFVKVQPHFFANSGPRWRWRVRITLWPMYSSDNSLRYPMDRIMVGDWNYSGRCREEKTFRLC